MEERSDGTSEGVKRKGHVKDLTYRQDFRQEIWTKCDIKKDFFWKC